MSEQQNQNIKFVDAQARVIALFTESAKDEDVYAASELAHAQWARKAASIAELYAVMAAADWDIESANKVILDM